VDAKSPISVRRVGAAELGRVAAITALINRAYSGAILELWNVRFERVRPEEVSAMIAAGEVFVAERPGRLIGCVRYRELDADAAWFGLLAVDPDSAGVGAGTALVEAVEAAAASTGRDRIELDLLLPSVDAPHQARLQAWYRRRGYVEVERTDFHPADASLPEMTRAPCVSIRHRKQLR
jgi:N-acetylglutamate synthase-like GNAT family acetyltransferase